MDLLNCGAAAVIVRVFSYLEVSTGEYLCRICTIDRYRKNLLILRNNRVGDVTRRICTETYRSM